MEDLLPLRRLVAIGLALGALAVIRLVVLTPFEPLRLVFIPVFVPLVVGAGWALAWEVRSFDRTDLVPSLFGIAFLAGVFLSSAVMLMLVLVPREDTALPGPIPTLFLIGALLFLVACIPLVLGDIARDRALGGRRAGIRGMALMVILAAMVFVVVRVLVFGPVGGG
jgi:hypothetical protein